MVLFPGITILVAVFLSASPHASAIPQGSLLETPSRLSPSICISAVQQQLFNLCVFELSEQHNTGRTGGPSQALPSPLLSCSQFGESGIRPVQIVATRPGGEILGTFVASPVPGLETLGAGQTTTITTTSQSVVRTFAVGPYGQVWSRFRGSFDSPLPTEFPPPPIEIAQNGKSTVTHAGTIGNVEVSAITKSLLPEYSTITQSTLSPQAPASSSPPPSADSSAAGSSSLAPSQTDTRDSADTTKLVASISSTALDLSVAPSDRLDNSAILTKPPQLPTTAILFPPARLKTSLSEEAESQLSQRPRSSGSTLQQFSSSSPNAFSTLLTDIPASSQIHTTPLTLIPPSSAEIGVPQTVSSHYSITRNPLESSGTLLSTFGPTLSSPGASSIIVSLPLSDHSDPSFSMSFSFSSAKSIMITSFSFAQSGTATLSSPMSSTEVLVPPIIQTTPPQSQPPNESGIQPSQPKPTDDISPTSPPSTDNRGPPPPPAFPPLPPVPPLPSIPRPPPPPPFPPLPPVPPLPSIPEPPQPPPRNTNGPPSPPVNMPTADPSQPVQTPPIVPTPPSPISTPLTVSSGCLPTQAATACSTSCVNNADCHTSCSVVSLGCTATCTGPKCAQSTNRFDIAEAITYTPDGTYTQEDVNTDEARELAKTLEAMLASEFRGGIFNGATTSTSQLPDKSGEPQGKVPLPPPPQSDQQDKIPRIGTASEPAGQKPVPTPMPDPGAKVPGSNAPISTSSKDLGAKIGVSTPITDPQGKIAVTTPIGAPDSVNAPALSELARLLRPSS